MPDTNDGREPPGAGKAPELAADARARAAKLRQRAGYATLHQSGLLPDAFEELHTTIEELRVAEEEMRAQNEELALTRLRVEAERHRYQDLFEFAPDGYLLTDLEGVILEANRAAAALVGITPRFLKGRTLATLVVPEDLAAYAARRRGLAAAPAPGAAEEWLLRLRRRPKAQFEAAVTVSRVAPLPNEAPTLRWLIRDITVRRSAEQGRLAEARAEARAEAARQVTAHLDTVTDQFVTLDQQWRFTYLNASAAQVVLAAGLDPDALIGQVIWDAFPTALGTAFQIEALRAVETRRAVEFEEYSRGLGRWLQVRVFPSEEGVAAYAQDITARKEAEAAAQAAYARERRISGLLQGLLLRTVPADAFPGLSVETLYQAADDEAEIGGDFFDVFAVADGRVALVVGDVSGKGLAAATLTAEIKYALRVLLRQTQAPAAAVARLNEFVCEAQRLGDFGSDRPVVLWVAAVDTATGETVCVTAGGEPLLVLRADGTDEMIQTGGLLLGIQPGVVYAEQSLTLETGDTLLMLTDGLTEARRSDSDLLGLTRLMALAADVREAETVAGMGEALFTGVRAWAGGPFTDDACLLLARRG